MERSLFGESGYGRFEERLDDRDDLDEGLRGVIQLALFSVSPLKRV